MSETDASCEPFVPLPPLSGAAGEGRAPWPSEAPEAPEAIDGHVAVELTAGRGAVVLALPLPEGRNGLQPRLTLRWSAERGDGPFGRGWALDLPSVHRIAAGLPRFDDSDGFALDGHALVSLGGGRYRPRADTEARRIARRDDAWELRERDGTVHHFGGAAATLHDPDNPGRVFAWMRSETRDPFGNRVVCTWERDPEGAAIYPSEIRYVDYGDPAAPQFLVAVRFVLERRPDPLAHHRAGFEVRSSRRCARIEVWTNAPAGEQRARSYHFDYADGPSSLVAVRMEGHDGARVERAAPVRFRYGAFDPARRRFFAVRGAELPPGSLADDGYDLIDLTGSGLPAVVERRGDQVRYWRNLGDGTLDRPRAWKGPLPPPPDADLQARAVDLDGDGRPDRMRTGSRIEYTIGGRTERVRRETLGALADIDLSDARLHFADMTGDGLPDLVRVTPTRVEYWPARGHGRWGERVTMEGAPRLPPGTDPTRVLVGDVDGDGRADVVLVDDASVTLWRNLDGARFAPPVRVAGTPSVSGGAVRLVDFLGDGTRGLLFSSPASAGVRARLHYLDLGCGELPHLLEEVDNGRGAVVRLRHAPATRFAAADAERHGMRWTTGADPWLRLLASVERVDRLSGARCHTAYRYHQPQGDGGRPRFTRVDRVESEEVAGESPHVVETRCWFHAEPVLAGRLARCERLILDGSARQARPDRVVEERWAVVAGADGVAAPRRVEERVTDWERGEEPRLVVRRFGDHDDHGQPRRELMLAVGRAGQPHLGTVVETRYAARDDAELYCVDRVAARTTFAVEHAADTPPDAALRALEDGSAPRHVTAHILHYYDGEAYRGLPLGQLGRHAARVRTEELLLTDELVARAWPEGAPPFLARADWPEEYPRPFRSLLPLRAGYSRPADADHHAGLYADTDRRRYDVHEGKGGRGLVKVVRDTLEHDQTFVYDACERFAVKINDAGGLTTQLAPDYRALRPRELVVPNGNRTVYGYSPLGALESVARLGKPGEKVGDTVEEPGTRWSWSLERAPQSVRERVRRYYAAEASGRDEAVETVTYFDGRGRVVQMRRTASAGLADDVGLPANGAVRAADSIELAAATGRVIVHARRYDAAGRPIAEIGPRAGAGWEFEPIVDGPTIAHRYDTRGRRVATARPDGIEERTIYGALAPDGAPIPTPWERWTVAADGSARGVAVDAHGRAIAHTERSADGTARVRGISWSPDGAARELTDALGRVAEKTVQDRRGRVLRRETSTGGVVRSVYDAVDNLVERRDARGALLLAAYDAQNRPLRRFARDAADEPVTLRERFVYGDAIDSNLTVTRAAESNLLGRLYRQYDEAGLCTVHAYDFAGRPTEKTRQAVLESDLTGVYGKGPVRPFRLDWQPPGNLSLDNHARSILDETPHQTAYRYDALGRLVWARTPRAADGRAHEITFEHHAAGGLARLALDGTEQLAHTREDVRGQRTLALVGGGALVRRAFDAAGRPARVRVESARLVDGRLETANAPLVDAAYSYGRDGRLASVSDPETHLTWDGFGALAAVAAAGPSAGSARSGASSGPSTPWEVVEPGSDGRAFTDRLGRDGAGALVELSHEAAGGSYTRRLTLDPATGRLTAVLLGDRRFDCALDELGQLRVEHTRHYEWDWAGRLRAFYLEGEGGPSLHAQYLYDPDGQRVQKLLWRSGGAPVELTVAVDGVFEHRRVGGRAFDSLTLADGADRIATVRVGDGDGPAVVYHVIEPLFHLRFDGTGALVDREEFAPHGETRAGGLGGELARFRGGLRDEESGLYFLGGRVYAPWLARVLGNPQG